MIKKSNYGRKILDVLKRALKYIAIGKFIFNVFEMAKEFVELILDWAGL